MRLLKLCAFRQECRAAATEEIGMISRLIFGTSIRRVKMLFKKVPPVYEYVSMNGLKRQGLLKLEKAIFKCIPCRVQVFPAMSYYTRLNEACNSPIGKTSAKSANLEAPKLTEHDGHDN